MKETGITAGERLAKTFRCVLIAAIGLLVVLIMAAPRREGAANPFSVGTANADLIAAAPGYIAISASMGTSTNFYLIDSTTKVICVYQMDGEKLRLVAARDFSSDTDIMDASLTVQGPDGRPMNPIEGGSGVDRKKAEDYAAGLKKYLDAATKKP